MGETKEEKSTRLAAVTAVKSPTDADAQPDEAVNADNPDEVPPETTTEPEISSHLVSVELNDSSESVLKNVHTIYHAKGSTDFVNGVANVNADVAAHLKESGQVK